MMNKIVKRIFKPSGALRPARAPGVHARQDLREHQHGPAARWHLHDACHYEGREGLYGQGNVGVKTNFKQKKFA